MSKIASGAVLALLLSVAGASAAPQLRFEGPVVHRLPPLPGEGCFVTTDRVRAQRFWDPYCIRQGAGIRPGDEQ